ncbi:hypothetical protein CDAR_582501 [Caerostris darwini]|uniref:Uncharacterized protein n=1 Tax=Caerostris darwini TaxID=1538125 RepID=A0AAV4RKE8_9ARAC|nr:hypothetical protein CDAR_582501 [Caerostris darwini]
MNTIKGKKWGWPIFINFIVTVKANSAKLYKILCDSKISLLDFQKGVDLSSTMKTKDAYAEDSQLPSSFSHCLGSPSIFQDLAVLENKKEPMIAKKGSNLK